jgi:hypothetical protein
MATGLYLPELSGAGARPGELTEPPEHSPLTDP